VDEFCPLKTNCNCPVSFKCARGGQKQDYAVLRACHKHNAERHAHSQAKYLSSEQKAGLRWATKCAPTESARQIRRNTSHFSPKSQVPHELFRSVQRVVYKQREETLVSHTEGIKLEGTEGAMNRPSQELDFELSPARHEDRTAPYHLGLHEVVCTGFQWDRKVRFMSLTTPLRHSTPLPSKHLH
jgi:hypothetical protein